MPGLNGCDTSRTFQLSVISSAPDTAFVNICDNTLPFLLPDGSAVSVGGSYFTAGIDTNGCADTTTTILTIWLNDSITDSVLVCQQNGYTLPVAHSWIQVACISTVYQTLQVVIVRSPPI